MLPVMIIYSEVTLNSFDLYCTSISSVMVTMQVATYNNCQLRCLHCIFNIMYRVHIDDIL